MCCHYSTEPPKPWIRSTGGLLVLTDYYFEMKHQQSPAMAEALRVIPEVADEFARISGRQYGLLDSYQLDDAEVGIVVLNSTASTTEIVVDGPRNQAVAVGMLRLRAFRPFPKEAIISCLSGLKALAVLDRDGALGYRDPLGFLRP